MLVMASAALPVLVSVKICAELVVFKVWFENDKFDDDKPTIGAGGTTPVPLRVIVWGLPAASSVMVTAADRVPNAAGVNVTLIVQFPLFAATELPQLFVCAKSPVFAPVITRLLIFSAPLPVLVSVTACAALVVFNVWLANASPAMERVTAGMPTPVPPRLMECGLPVAVSVRVTAAVRVPTAVGVNVTLIVQLPLFAATELPQVLVCE
jgi:hypothetical protein